MAAARRRGISAAFAAALVAAAAGCADRPPAAASNLRLTPEEEEARVLLDDSEQAEALAAMRLAARDHEVGEPPKPAPPETGAMRWSDVPAAAAAASEDVEAAIVARDSGAGDVWRFRLRTIEDWPGLLTVRRVDGETLYRATATFGRFPDEAKNVQRAETLVTAFATHMRALGAKRGWGE